MESRDDIVKQLNTQSVAAQAYAGGSISNSSSTSSTPATLELDPDLMLQHSSHVKPVAQDVMEREKLGWFPLLEEWKKGWREHFDGDLVGGSGGGWRTNWQLFG
jgi:hypothetical protein